MRPALSWLRLRNMPILQQLRLEEALFRGDQARSWFVTNEWDQAAQAAREPAAEAIVLGISGKVEEMVDVDRAAARDQLPIIKRFTGGGTVVVDTGTIYASFLMADGALPTVAPYPEPILQWTGGVYRRALASLGVEGFRVNANDYCLDHLKFGGNAQAISGKRWLHHTSLLWEVRPEMMALLRMPAKQPEYRANRTHSDFVRGLGDALADRTGFVEALAAAAGAGFDMSEASLDDASAALDVPHRKITRLLDLRTGGPLLPT